MRFSPPDFELDTMGKAPHPIHARVMTLQGNGPGWCGSPGRRVYSDRRAADGQVEFPCRKKLDDEHKASGEKHPWASVVSKRSREARYVTCPDCARWLRAFGYKYAPPEPATVNEAAAARASGGGS